jgi:hypothetical protein
MEDLFVIAAGGTGAKVAEALIHLCAAGVGPDSVNLLLIDGDVTNGNRLRTEHTFNAYNALKDWPWTVSVGVEKPVQLFKSKVNASFLSERFDQVDPKGLAPQVVADLELNKALRVILTNEEMTRDLGIGFAGCPNLGCLVMDEYLRRHFRKHPGALDFVNALKKSAGIAGSMPRVAVVGSIFGGTGASLLPVVRRIVEDLFRGGGAPGENLNPLITRLRWSRIMQLPYFQPKRSIDTEKRKVNPSRYLYDTSGALWYYGKTGLGSANGGPSEPTYLIGSEAPEKRELPLVEGGSAQTNPAFYHELLSALAILDFYQNPEVVADRPIRHFSSQREEICSLSNLPRLRDSNDVSRKLGLLLHLAAFALKWRKDEAIAYRMGLFQYAQNAQKTGWPPSVQRLITLKKHELIEEGGSAHHAMEYFARVLLWATSTLAENNSSGMSFITHSEQESYYSSLHNTMASIGESEIYVPNSDSADKSKDNLTAAICRLACAALLFGDSRTKDTSRPSNLPDLALVEHGDAVRVGIEPNTIMDLLTDHDHGLKSETAEFICNEYLSTPLQHQ